MYLKILGISSYLTKLELQYYLNTHLIKLKAVSLITEMVYTF
jgi:hypothetical protein